MAYLCVSNDCRTRAAVGDVDQTFENNSYQQQQQQSDIITSDPVIEEEDFVIPDYVCCVLTEETWTVFGACLLILGLFTMATLKYFKKYLAQTKYTKKNLRMKNRLVYRIIAISQNVWTHTPIITYLNIIYIYKINTLFNVSRHVKVDGKNAAALIRQGGVPLNQFLQYCSSRRKTPKVDEMVTMNQIKIFYNWNAIKVISISLG